MYRHDLLAEQNYLYRLYFKIAYVITWYDGHTYYSSWSLLISSNTIIIHPPKIQLLKPICCNTNNYIYRFKNDSTFYLLVFSSSIICLSNSLRVKVAENKACQKHLEIRQLFSCNSFFAFFMQTVSRSTACIKRVWSVNSNNSLRRQVKWYRSNRPVNDLQRTYLSLNLFLLT